MYGLSTITTLAALLLGSLVLAAPQPRPAGSLEDRALYSTKQTNRRAVIDRLQNPPQRRTSPIVYPHCANASPHYSAAVYAGYQTGSNEPADYINNVPADSFDECIEICRNTPGCKSGDWHVLPDPPGNSCYMIKDPAPPLRYKSPTYSAFVMDTDCATFATTGQAPAGAQCCNY